MKKMLFATLLSLSVFAGGAHAALAGIMTGGMSIVIAAVGGGLLGSGAVGVLTADKEDRFYQLAKLVSGALLMDASGEGPRYQPVTVAQANEIGLSQAEAAAYHAELAQINLALADAADRVDAQLEAGAHPDATGIWEASARDARLSAESLAAVRKVTVFAVRQAR